MIEKRYVLTIAVGKKTYLDMAINLARSFFWWHADSDIEFQLITDQPAYIAHRLQSNINIISIKTGEFGEGFSSKLFLDKLASVGQTLFIDSDCLIFGKLDTVFEKFKGHPVSVIGDYIDKGEWFGNIKKICDQYKVPHLPKFNGGIYYLEKSERASSVYQMARELEKEYDQIGFKRLRNKPNDEVLMALAMQLNNQQPIRDDGTIMSDPQACPGIYQIDVIKGKAELTNPPLPSPLHQNWYPFEKVNPVIVHFLGYYTEHYPYKRETYRLKKGLLHKQRWFTDVKSLLTIEYPDRFKIWIKATLRPAFHFFFGPRVVKKSTRI